MNEGREIRVGNERWPQKKRERTTERPIEEQKHIEK
jgi:hypothetical protein